jgi:hypothetical protein
VVRSHGFAIAIFTHDHTDRAHVHVRRAGGVVVIELATDTRAQAVCRLEGMRDVDVHRASRVVWEHSAMLMTAWRKIHGEAGTR